jgi:uncharacterized metal-binding protein YceD (DUF177 family)
MSSEALEFSRIVPIGMVGRQEKREELQATAPECAALAVRFGILAVNGLTASLRLRQESGGAVRVRGRLAAKVVQACVVTLEPVPQKIDEPVDLRFVPEGAEVEDDPEGPDEIPIRNNVLELGEALAEQLALALDPYPRAPGASLGEEGFSIGEDDVPAPQAETPVTGRPNPFAGLAALKNRKQ